MVYNSEYRAVVFDIGLGLFESKGTVVPWWRYIVGYCSFDIVVSTELSLMKLMEALMTEWSAHLPCACLLKQE